ncbi:MAG: hypothetical protein K8U57_04865 [Planctomycetes bacterium]|nr:hypothetical protein [Planctomycetota bacterium]
MISIHLNSPLRRLAVAAWGVCWGVLLATTATAAMIAVNGDTQNRSHPALLRCEYLQPYEIVPWQEHYEQSWYVFVCVAGALGGWAATRFARPSPCLIAMAVIVFIPAATGMCRSVFAGKLVLGKMLTCVGILTIPLLTRRPRSPSFVLSPSPLGGGVGEGSSKEPNPPTPFPKKEGGAGIADGSPSARMWPSAITLCLPLAALLYGVFAPADLAATAWECNVESHVASYLVGPAQYYRAPEVVPGLDFESHYGIGHAYAFSCVMGSGGYQSVLERFVLFVLIVSIAYVLTAQLVLTDWLQNPWAALVVTLGLAAMATEGLAYQMPSCWPVRHPFAFAFLFCAVRGTDNSRWCVAAGAVGGLSLFWQTDIGLFTLAAGAALYLANAVFLGGSWWKPGVFVATGFGVFLALCLVLFGPRVLTVTFAERLLEPLRLYATGFGTTLLNWRAGWSYWFNLIGPGVAIASVSAMIGYGRGRVPPRGVVYAAVASLLGLAMLTKWVNRSIDILWALNGGLVLAVAGWWAWTAWREATLSRGLPSRFALGAVVIALILVAGRFDARTAHPDPLLRTTSPLVRIVNRLDTFPNPINATRREIVRKDWPAPFDEEAVAYLRDNTTPTERVTVISRHDWSFLAAAGRAPRLSWQPFFLVHSPILLERCVEDLRNSERVFVDHNALMSLAQLHPSASSRVEPILQESFEVVEHVGRWTLYARKSNSLAQK